MKIQDKECCNLNLMGYSGQSSEDYNGDRNVNTYAQAQEISLWGENFIGN